jgi:S-adenosylhomocysteine hydrolase
VREFVFTSESVAEGHPNNVAGEAGPEVHGVPEVIDRQIARLKARTLGVEIDQLNRRAGAVPVVVGRGDLVDVG